MAPVQAGAARTRLSGPVFPSPTEGRAIGNWNPTGHGVRPVIEPYARNR